MLDYEWGNPSPIMLSGDDPTQEPDQTRHIFDHYNQTLVNDPNVFTPHHHLFHPQTQTHSHFHSLYDGASFSPPPPTAAMSLESVGGAAAGQNGPAGVGVDFMSRIGLNLGGRTYFSSSSEEDFVNRLYRRSRKLEPGSASSPRCQVEGCNADMTHAKHYHRRHKVCEFHSKAATVVADRLTQRFCQQCSRFHLLSEFDNGKRSCRKRLADHNRRRRKCQQANKSHLENAPNSSSQNLARSLPESGAHPSSSVTIAISPPRMSLECFREGSNQTATTSTSSLLFSNG